MTFIDHALIAKGMKCTPLPRRNRGAQSTATKAAFEAALSEWFQEIIRAADTMDCKIGARDWCYPKSTVRHLRQLLPDLAADSAPSVRNGARFFLCPQTNRSSSYDD
jgi:hypothetical protein